MLKSATQEKQSSTNSATKKNILSCLYTQGRKIIVSLHKIAENNPATSSTLRFVINQLQKSKLINHSNKWKNRLQNLNGRLKLSLAHSLLAQGDMEKAMIIVEDILVESPNYSSAYVTLAECFFYKNQLQKAIELMFTAIELAPQFIEAHFILGYFLYSMHELDKAETSLKKALLLKPDYVEAMNYLGMVYQEQQRFLEAEKMYRKAIGLKSNYAIAHNNLGFLLKKLERTEEATANFKIAYNLDMPHLVLPSQTPGIKHTLNLLKRYFLVSTDILRWSMNCGLRQNAWTDYRLLNQATNGISSDYFSNALRVLTKKPPSFPQWKTSTILPSVKKEDVTNIIETLERDGIYVFDQLIDTDFLDEVQSYAMSATAVLQAPRATSKTQHVKLHAKYDPDNPLASGYFFNEGDMLQQPIFQRFSGDPLLLTIAREYMGIEPKFNELTCWWSTVFARNPVSDMAQLYHNDLSHIKWLNFFVYITDVTKSTGPHTYVLGSHKPDEPGRSLRSRGLIRISDEDIHRTFGQDRILDVVGPRGTIFVADTRGYHKGQRLLNGHRLVLQSILVNSSYPDIGKKNYSILDPSQGNSWSLVAKDPVLIEAIKHHPKVYSQYRIAKKTEQQRDAH